MRVTKYAKRMIGLERSALRQLFDKAPKNSINLGLGEIQFCTPQVIRDRAIEVIKQNEIRYTPNAGLPELQKTIAKYYNIKLQDNVCVTTGAEEAIFSALFSYIDPGDEVLIANPSYIAYKTIIQMLNGKPVEFYLEPKSNFSLDRNDFLKKISIKTKVLLLNNPSNPTGRCFSEDEIDFIIQACHKNDVLIIVDEIYRELYIERRIGSFLNRSDNIIVISGLSKSHSMSGWRIGWAISNQPDLIKPVIVSHQYICTCAPYISQQVAITALSEEGMKTQNEIRLQLLDNRKFILDQFQQFIPDIPILKSDSFPYLFINVNTDEIPFINKLIKKGVILIPGSIFGTKGRQWIRLNYAIDKKKLAKGLNILKSINIKFYMNSIFK